MSIRNYIFNFKLIQTAIVAFPTILGRFSEKPIILGPPLGSLANLVSPLGLLVVGLFAIAPWLIKTRRLAIATLIFGTCFAIVSLITYANLIEKYVVTIERFNPHVVARVSAGKVRTPFANQNYPVATSLFMVKDHGHREEDLQDLWTETSIATVRQELLASYILFFLFLNVAIGAFARASDLDRRVGHT